VINIGFHASHFKGNLSLGPGCFRFMLGGNKDDDKLTAMVLFTFSNQHFALRSWH